MLFHLIEEGQEGKSWLAWAVQWAGLESWKVVPAPRLGTRAAFSIPVCSISASSPFVPPSDFSFLLSAFLLFPSALSPFNFSRFIAPSRNFSSWAERMRSYKSASR
jgi:hypothetical protein